MAKTTLPEIGNWIEENTNSKFHVFSFDNELEKVKILSILEKFAKNHSNYYICNEGERIVLVKEECQTT